MKRYLLGILAVLVAVASLAFTRPVKSPTTFTAYYWKFNSGTITDLSNYSQLADIPNGPTALQQYTAMCVGSSSNCAIRTNTTTPTLSDVDSDNIPDLTGGVDQVRRKP